MAVERFMQSIPMDKKRFTVIVSIMLLLSSGLVTQPYASGSSINSGPDKLVLGYVTVTSPSLSDSLISNLHLTGAVKTGAEISAGEYSSSSQPYYTSSSSLSSVAAAIPGLWLDSSNRKRRTRSQIYVEILELMKQRGPMTPFEIAFYARLNHKRTKECADFLKLCGYLQDVGENGRITYVLTREGLGFLERAKALFQETKPTATEIPNLDHKHHPDR